MKFTVLCVATDLDRGTYITHQSAPDIDEAKAAARQECAGSWNCEPNDVIVLGVAEGFVNFLDWQDPDH